MHYSPVLTAFFLVAGGLSACSSQPDAAKGKPGGGVATENPLTQRGGPFRQQWAMDSLWEDGKAEVATYHAQREVHGEPRQFESTLITVKEEFSQQHNVHTTSPDHKSAFPVLKVVQASSIPTDEYAQHFLTALFFRRDQPVQLHKLTTSSQEWCGTTFKAITDDGLQYQQSYNSYQDGEGTGQRQLRRDVLFEDALPYTLRSLRFEQNPAFKAPIYESQQTTRATVPVLYQAQVRAEEAPATEAPEPAWRVTVALTAQKQNVYWFSKQYPNLLLRQTTWDGRTLHLKQVRRYVYWPTEAVAAPDSTTDDLAALPILAPVGQ